MMRLRSGYIACTVLLGACGSADRVASRYVVRDSAGVIVVENRAGGAWRDATAWRLSAESVVDIGVAAGPDEYRLYQVTRAKMLRDGRIVVVNGGTNELRFYDGDGAFLFTAGREGEGPGEFQDLSAVWELPGDSLLAYDFIVQRLSVFTGDGEFVRSFRLESPERRLMTVRGLFGDGSLLVTGYPRFAASGTTTGLVRVPVPYYRYDLEGSLVDSLGYFPSVQTYGFIVEGNFRFTSPPFNRKSDATASGGQFYYGSSDRWEIAVHSRDGTLARLIRLDRPNRSIITEDRARFREERREWASEFGPRSLMIMESMLAAVPYPETMPAYGELRVDAVGNLWVGHYRARWEDHSRWSVFDPEGRFLGIVDLPDRFEVYEIGSDDVLGSWADELGVEHVRIYSLLKS